MLQVATVMHATPSRVRLRFENHTEVERKRVVDLFAKTGNIKYAYRPGTRSLVIRRQGAEGSLMPAVEALAESGLVTIGRRPPKSYSEQLSEVIESGDEAIRRASGGKIDGRFIAFLALGGLAAWQFSRKQFLPAGLTLLIDGLALLEISRLKDQHPEK